MKIINGENIALGRLASHVAKELLKGEEIAVINCEKIIITGNKKSIEQDFKEKRSKVGSSQKGPKYSINSEKIVKRCIRGMLPDYRKGRGRVAYKKIKCYKGTPKEFQDKEIIKLKERKINKSLKIGEITKWIKS